MKTVRKFGVEIEVKANPYDYGDTWVQYGRGESSCDCCPPSDGGETIQMPGDWKFAEDGSCGSEFVSPILSDTEEVQEMIDVIHASDFDYSFEDCGLHIHVDARDFAGDHKGRLINVARFCRHFERIIFSFMAKDRKSDDYCKNISMSNDYLKNRFDSFHRYHGCNIAAWHKFNTIEFRYAEGTTDFDRIATLAEFYTKLVDRSWNFTRLKTPRSRIPKMNFLFDYLELSKSCRDNLEKASQMDT